MIAAGPSVKDDSTIELRLRRVNEVKIMSTTLSHPRSVDPEFRRPLWDGEEALRFIALPTMDDLARTSMELSLLVDKKLRKKVFSNEIDAIYFHVLDFNFTLIKNKVLGRFTTANRDHYNSHQMVILITISPGFARTWTPTKMDEWIKWRDAEDAADRGLTIEYRVSGSFTLDEGELEEIRVFLHYHNLYGDKGGRHEAHHDAFQAVFRVGVPETWDLSGFKGDGRLLLFLFTALRE
jgi:hypothetical protein